ncbi:MAG TPA: beta-ketoacyl-[acyl-carrier-protein] synthase II, partial [Anaerolineae bacterium]|nr:beta-ketoacyl-[acyl-carrier-protein] synthase II [Anaerolineae bacterium]
TIFSGLTTNIGALVWDYNEAKYFESKESRRMSRSSQLGLVAAQEAISQAKLDNESINRQN